MKPLGVVMLSASFHPYIGGAEKQALELSKALSRLGLKVSVLTRRLPGLKSEEKVEGIPVFRTAAWGRGVINAVVFLCSSFLFLIRKSASYQAIHVHLAGSPAIAACLAGRIMGKRVLIKLGGGRGVGEISGSAHTLTGRLKLLTFKFLKPNFVAVTRELVDELRAHGLPGDDVEIVPNGVDTRVYSPVPSEEKNSLRAELGWPKGLVFLYVGRLSPEKRLDFFLEVFVQVAAAQALFVMAGTGPMAGSLRQRVADLGLEGRVLFLTPPAQIQRVYAAADVFVLPSVSEGLSNALLEAMSSGLAVLASRVGGTKEAVSEGQAGFLFDPNDGRELEGQLRKFLDEPALAQQLGARARRTAAEHFSMERVAERYQELYNK